MGRKELRVKREATRGKEGSRTAVEIAPRQIETEPRRSEEQNWGKRERRGERARRERRARERSTRWWWSSGETESGKGERERERERERGGEIPESERD